MNDSLAAELEKVAARAWPALAHEQLAGWTLRYSDGVTRRANSVLPMGWLGGQADLEPALVRVEAAYRARGLRPRFQISPAGSPTGLDEVLAERGYGFTALTAVQTAPIAVVVGQLSHGGDWREQSNSTPSDDWLAVYADAERASEDQVRVRQAIMAAIPDRACYAVVYDRAGRAAAVGSGVVADGLLGIFNMATVPHWRRQGAAQAAMRSLVTWGNEQAARTVYLQVMSENEPALALYARLGFETQYHYHYRELD